MRAALLSAIRESMVVEDIDYLDPAAGRVLIRTGASPFCSTDVVNWRGEARRFRRRFSGTPRWARSLRLGPALPT